MNLTYITLELVCISLGAGAAFMFDSFFILSSRYHKIKPLELRILRRLSLLSITSSFGAIIFYGTTIAEQFQGSSDLRISIITSKMIFLAVTLVAGIAMRKVHLKALVRHQGQYAHLSESMSIHPDPLISTASYSTISWMAVIFLTALEFRQVDTFFNFGFISIMTTYIVFGIIFSKFAVYLKKK